MSDLILAAKKDSKHANSLFRLVDVKPIDGPVDRQMSQARQQIVVTLTNMRRRTEPIGFLADITDTVLAMTQRRLS